MCVFKPVPLGRYSWCGEPRLRAFARRDAGEKVLGCLIAAVHHGLGGLLSHCCCSCVQ